MMSFLARSALCIGVVAAAASGVGKGSIVTAIDRSAREAAQGAGRACLGSDGCLRVGTAALAAAAARARAPVSPSAEPPPRGPAARASARRTAPPGG